MTRKPLANIVCCPVQLSRFIIPAKFTISTQFHFPNETFKIICGQVCCFPVRKFRSVETNDIKTGNCDIEQKTYLDVIESLKHMAKLYIVL